MHPREPVDRARRAARNSARFRFRESGTADRIVSRSFGTVPTSSRAALYAITFGLRASPVGLPKESGEPPLDLPKGPPKIVIADDNLQNVELLEAYLSDVECEIRTAFDGEDTLRVVHEFEPDLLLLDVMMPRLSGFEVCRKTPRRPGHERPAHPDGHRSQRGV